MKPTKKSPADASNKAHATDMRSLMLEYHRSHVNQTNQRIHYVCVPLIFWSITALLWLVKIPVVLNLAMVVAGLLMLYYGLKSVRVLVVMSLFTAACLGINYYLELQGVNLLWWSIGVFVVAWVGQFIGHHIEGQRPSFFQDLQFLLIGPAWVAFKFLNLKP